MSSQNVYCVHLFRYEFVKAVDDFFRELICKLVFFEVSQSLLNQPDMHVCNWIMDVEVFLEVKLCYELPRVHVK
jgi:hypothetical protein